MNGIKYVFKKEMDRVLKDRKMIFSLFILPVVLIIGIYTLMGNVISGQMDDIESHQGVVIVQNAPDSFKQYLETADDSSEITYDTDDVGAARDGILNGTVDLMVEFPDDFEVLVDSYQQGSEIPQVKTFYNPSEEYSSSIWSGYVTGILEGYRLSLLSERTGDLESIAVFHVDNDNPDMIIQDDDKATGKVLGTMVPYLITILLFAGVMSLGVDSITGEKERGTMASLLVTPVKRSSIVIGKLLSLMLLSIMSAAMYAVSMVAAMPMMMKSMTGGEEIGLSFAFTAGQAVELIVLLAVFAFVYVAFVGVVAVHARTIKEGTSYVMPVYILIVAVGMVTMFSTSNTGGIRDYLIPLYNNSLAIKALLARELTTIQFAATAISNLAAGGIVTYVIIRAFNSEKVMFNA